MPPHSLLTRACDLAVAYLSSVGGRHVGGRASREGLAAALGGPLPDGPADPIGVLTDLARDADPGLVATAGPRYFGFVTGGAVPVTVAADWLASAWDQNGALYVMSPAASVMEDTVSAWLLELLGLPRAASVGFATGAHMANFTCLAAARHEVLRRTGWDVEADGLQRAPRLTVVAGDEVHVSVVGALRMLGVGANEVVKVAADGQGRMRPSALAQALGGISGPLIVCAQVGNVNTGANDPIGEIAGLTHQAGGWLHVDGAFGLWAAAVPALRGLVTGLADADSWTTDAHKWLNVPYDSGLAIVRHPAPHRAAMSLQASYLVRGADEERVGMDWVPESSRRSRVIPLYALIRALGRSGIADMVGGTVTLAQRMAARLGAAPGIVILNEVVLNQVLVRFGDDDAATRRVIAAVQADGTCWVGGAVWQGRAVMRISVSNWSTTAEDIDMSADAISRCWKQAIAD